MPMCDWSSDVCSSDLFPGDTMVKNSPASARDTGLIPGSRRYPGVENGNPFQYSCLENVPIWHKYPYASEWLSSAPSETPRTRTPVGPVGSDLGTGAAPAPTIVGATQAVPEPSFTPRKPEATLGEKAKWPPRQQCPRLYSCRSSRKGGWKPRAGARQG